MSKKFQGLAKIVNFDGDAPEKISKTEAIRVDNFAAEIEKINAKMKAYAIIPKSLKANLQQTKQNAAKLLRKISLSRTQGQDIATGWQPAYFKSNTGIAKPALFSALQGKSGVYLIRKIGTEKILYIGCSPDTHANTYAVVAKNNVFVKTTQAKKGNLGKVVYRHFQYYNDRAEQHRAYFAKKLDYEIKIILTTPNEAFALEQALLFFYKPKANFAVLGNWHELALFMQSGTEADAEQQIEEANNEMRKHYEANEWKKLEREAAKANASDAEKAEAYFAKLENFINSVDGTQLQWTEEEEAKVSELFLQEAYSEMQEYASNTAEMHARKIIEKHAEISEQDLQPLF